MATQFTTNEQRGREYINELLPTLGVNNFTFSENQFSPYDVEFEFKGKKCIGEIKYLYKYSSNSFQEVYLEQKKIKGMEDSASNIGANKLFYFFIYNDNSVRIFDITKWRENTTVEKYAPKTYSDKTMVIKKFIELPNKTGLLTSL